MEKQPVAWKVCCVVYWCGKTRKRMSWWTGRRDMTDKLLKTALNHNQSINFFACSFKLQQRHCNNNVENVQTTLFSDGCDHVVKLKFSVFLEKTSLLVWDSSDLLTLYDILYEKGKASSRARGNIGPSFRYVTSMFKQSAHTWIIQSFSKGLTLWVHTLYKASLKA